MSVTAALIGAGAAVAGSAGSAISAGKTNRRGVALAREQNEWNKAAADLAWSRQQEAQQSEWNWNLEQWNRENEYNTPAAQMQRLIDAGLNPNLVYGNGAAQSTSVGSPQYSAPTAPVAKGQSPPSLTAPRFDFDGAQYAILSSQARQMDAQTDYIQQQRKNAAVDESLKTLQTLGAQFDYDFKKETRDMAKQQLYLNLENTQQDVFLKDVKHRLETEKIDLTRAQIDYVRQSLINMRTNDDLQRLRYELEKMGISSSDNIFVRIASRMLVTGGDNALVNLINKLLK